LRIEGGKFEVKEIFMATTASVRGRQLGDLISIGPAMLRDFAQLRIRSVGQLARQNPKKMYERLNRLSGQRQNPCVLDVFCAAVAQAKNPRLPAEKCQWWYWSRKRKMGKR
jgi:pathogenicity locus Cdd1 protein